MESTWIKTSPPTELVEYLSRTTGVKEILTSDSWKELLEDSRLRDVEVRTYKVNALGQFINEISYIGLKDYLRGWHRFLSLIVSSPAFRKYLKEAWPPKNISKSYLEYLGYGIYVGQK
ncbi:MAG: hypothetical protein U9O41_06865 [Candidatus Aerophobetes bacterium]|nr:hypothetical protein [Candidatus Aerophobetes bacterium]